MLAIAPRARRQPLPRTRLRAIARPIADRIGARHRRLRQQPPACDFRDRAARAREMTKPWRAGHARTRG
jgi:hypothetical protein